MTKSRRTVGWLRCRKTQNNHTRWIKLLLWSSKYYKLYIVGIWDSIRLSRLTRKILNFFLKLSSHHHHCHCNHPNHHCHHFHLLSTVYFSLLYDETRQVLNFWSSCAYGVKVWSEEPEQKPHLSSEFSSCKIQILVRALKLVFLPRQLVVDDHLLQARGNAAARLSRRRVHRFWGLTRCHVDTGRVGQSHVYLPQDPGKRAQLRGCVLHRQTW